MRFLLYLQHNQNTHIMKNSKEKDDSHTIDFGDGKKMVNVKSGDFRQFSTAKKNSKSEASKDSSIGSLKVGDTVKIENYAGIFTSAKVDRIQGDSILYTNKDGDFGNIKITSNRIDWDTKEEDIKKK